MIPYFKRRNELSCPRYSTWWYFSNKEDGTVEMYTDRNYYYNLSYRQNIKIVKTDLIEFYIKNPL